MNWEVVTAQSELHCSITLAASVPMVIRLDSWSQQGMGTIKQAAKGFTEVVAFKKIRGSITDLFWKAV